MPRFRYVARDQQGAVTKGTIQSETRQRALDQLWQTDASVMQLEEVSGARSLLARRQRKIKPVDLALLCRQLAAMVDAGVGAIEALETIAHQSGDPAMTSAMESVIRSLEDGNSMADAFRIAEVFPDLFYRMISAGESSGSLETTLLELAEHYEREVWLAQKVRSALVYPKAVIAVASAVVIFMVVYVFPYFVELFFTFDMELPLPTRLVMGVADFAGRWWYLLLLLGIGGYFAWGRLLQRDDVRLWWDRMYLKTPVLGELQWKIALNQMTATLGTLLRSGIPLIESLQILQGAVNNRYFAEAMRETEVYLQGGLSLSESFARHPVFTPILLRMVAVGEESGTLDSMLSKVATFYRNDVEAITERLTQMLEPALVVSMGAVVGFLLLSMYMPMFDIFSGIR